MRWQKLISTILHPIVIPTLGVLSFFILTDIRISKQQQIAILSIIFIATYLVPILLLALLKGLGLIENYQVHSIQERKTPLFFMMALFFFLGKTFMSISFIRDFSILFYGTTISLVIVYFLFFLKIKSSLHLLSMGSAAGFIVLFSTEYNYQILPILSILIIISGFLANARLDLKAHNQKEIYIGFFLGIIGQATAFYWLQ